MVRLSDAAIDEISVTPQKVLHFWMQDDVLESEPTGFWGRLFGKKDTGIYRCSVSREEGDETDLDKAWEAMDYLLSDGRKTGGIARFLTEGGQEIPEEVGYGSPRAIRSSAVKQIAEFLTGVTPEILHRRYDGPAMDRAKIYPQIWTRDGDEGFDYVISFLEPMRSFIQEASRREMGILIIFT